MSPRGTTTAWYQRAQELLEDGEWHDGQAFLREVAKVITPGVAQRQTERSRASGDNAPAERMKPLPLARQIEQGKRAILAELVRQRTRAQTWETDPPYPMGHSLFDAQKPWRIRRLRGTVYLSVPEVAERFLVRPGAVRDLIRQRGLPAEDIGKQSRELLRVRSDDLPQYETAIKEWLATEGKRLAARQARAAETRTESNIARYLTEQVGPSPDSPMVRVRRLVADLARLRHEYRNLRAENITLREELAALKGESGDVS